MRKKLLAAIVAAFIANLVCLTPVRAQKGSLSADEVRAQIAKLGTGPKAVVRVTLADKRKAQGWVSAVAEDHFTLTDEKSGAATTITYSEVKQVKSLKPSKGLIAVVAVAVVGAAALVFLFAGSKH
jgi:glucose-6-phosphate dehydrogenase assembly protein OpcA